MSEFASLLPPNATDAERGVERTGLRLDEMAVPVRHLWNPDTCPAAHLPWLAWALSVDNWETDWPEAVKRQTLRRSVAVHRRKGTPAALRDALEAIGFADVEIDEGLPIARYDGTETHAGAETYGGGTRWAMFTLLLDLGEWRGLSDEGVARVIDAVGRVKPVRSHLADLAFRVGVADTAELAESAETEVAHTASDVLPWGRRYDGTTQHDDAVRLAHDGAQDHGGAVAYAGWTDIEGRHDAVRARTVIEIDLGQSDRMEIAPRHDGRFRHSGITHGAGQPPAADMAMPITLTRHRLHDGRHRHAGALHDGALNFDASQPYWAGIYHSGAETTAMTAM